MEFVKLMGTGLDLTIPVNTERWEHRHVKEMFSIIFRPPLDFAPSTFVEYADPTA